MSQGERRLAAIMFTDIQGYTALTQKDEASAMRLLGTFRAMVRPVIEKRGGREVKTMGDGSLVEFASALDASECAVEMQRALHDYNGSAQTPIMLRVGIHVGDVIHDAGDVYGDAVNIASRIEPLAAPGGICITEQVYYQVRNKLPYPGVKIESKELKNVSSPTEVYRLELPWEAKGSVMRGAMDRRRLAVLPFDNISPNPGDDYFADGLTDELITALSKVRGLEVIARTSVLRYKGGSKQINTIAEELQVGSILEGSVRMAGNRIRVTAQLIETSNQAHILAETYDRQLDDIFAVQSEIATKVAEKLRLEFSAPKGGEQIPTVNLEAYTLCLKGRFAGTTLSRESLSKAIDLYERAIALEPSFAACYADLAQAWLLLGFFELLPSKDALPKAKLYAAKALELDPNLAAGHVAMGRLLRLLDWKFTEADEELKLATELEPSFAAAHAFRAQGLDVLLREGEAIEEAKKALELDPFSAQTCMVLGTVYLYEKRYAEAQELYERALEITPNSPFPLGNLGLTFVQQGMVERGISLLEKGNQIEGSNPSSMNDLAYAYAKGGRMEDARKILEGLLEMHKDSQRAAPSIAGVYTTLGEYDKAFEWLAEAVRLHTPYLASIQKDFIFDPLRSDPRYKELMRSIGLPSE